MGHILLSTGRLIDNTCPYSSDCFANMGCFTQCPTTLWDVLERTAELEHEVGFFPHTDPEIAEVCGICKRSLE